MTKPLKKHRKNVWESFQWPFIAGLASGALILGYLGFFRYYAALGEPRSPLDLLYLSLQLFTLESGSVAGNIFWELEIARFLAPAVAAFAALKALAVIFRNQLQLIKVKFFQDHVVICGLGKRGMIIAQKFRELRYRVVIIELDEGNDLIDQCRDFGAVVFTGDATEGALLRKANVHRAKHLIAVTGDDGANTEIAIHAFAIVKNNKGHLLTCIIHIFDPQLSQLLCQQELNLNEVDSFQLKFFNVYEKGAQVWLDRFFPLIKDELATSAEPHLLIIGAGQLGESLIHQAALRWEKFRGTSPAKLKVDIIDRYAEVKMNRLYSQYSDFKNKCEITPLTTDITSPDFQHGQFLFDERNNCRYKKIFVCLDNDSLGLSTAMSIHQKLQNHEAEVVVRMARDAGLATLLQDKNQRKEQEAGIFAFSLLERTCSPELLLSPSARAVP